MPKFSKESLKIKAECHKDLQVVLDTVIKVFDFSVVWGRRGKETQNTYYEIGFSKHKYPDSKHNVSAPELSEAVDIRPHNEFPMFKTKEYLLMEIYYLAGLMMGCAEAKGIKLKWSGHDEVFWNIEKVTLSNYWHFELDEAGRNEGINACPICSTTELLCGHGSEKGCSSGQGDE